LFLSDFSPVLCNSVILATFQADGNMPVVIQMFINLVSDGAIAEAANFTSQALRSFIPVALLVEIACINYNVCCVVISGKTILLVKSSLLTRLMRVPGS
jgi:hypothetical protein